MSIKSRLTRTVNVLLNRQTTPTNNIDSRNDNFLNIILEKLGNRISYENQSSMDSLNNPIPWFTYPSIEYLNQIDLSNMEILEWGLGNSTLYFSKRCKNITAIEHNYDWYNAISKKMPSNCFTHLTDTENYASLPASFKKKYDLIIVDGINRLECIKASLSLLKENGFIIFDNSDRNPDFCKFLRNHDLIQIDFHGFGPIVNFTTTTSFFFTRTINLKPLTVQPLLPTGGGY